MSEERRSETSEINPEEEFEGLQEFSDSLRCHPRTTVRYIAIGELEAAYVGGKYLISRAAKARFLQGRLGARPAHAGKTQAEWRCMKMGEESAEAIKIEHQGFCCYGEEGDLSCLCGALIVQNQIDALEEALENATNHESD